MNRFVSALLIVFVGNSLADTGVAASQTSSPSATELRTRAIVASFSKSKHVVKESHGVRREKYKDVRSEPVVRSNLLSLSGTYEVPDLGFVLYLRVDADGRVQGSGEERIATRVRRAFTLANARVDGALLTGTKVYSGGEAESLEGVFINRTSYESPTDKGFTGFGLGVLGRPVQLSGLTIDKFFYQLRR